MCGGSSVEMRGKAGKDGRTAVDKMARRCTEVGAKVRCGRRVWWLGGERYVHERVSEFIGINQN